MLSEGMQHILIVIKYRIGSRLFEKSTCRVGAETLMFMVFGCWHFI